jgi:hypothetical protein
LTLLVDATRLSLLVQWGSLLRFRQDARIRPVPGTWCPSR